MWWRIVTRLCQLAKNSHYTNNRSGFRLARFPVSEIAWFQQLPLTPFRVMHKKRRPKIGRRFRSQQQFAEKAR